MSSLLQISSGPQFEVRAQLICPPGQRFPAPEVPPGPGHLGVSIGLGLVFSWLLLLLQGQEPRERLPLEDRWVECSSCPQPCPHLSPDTITNRPVKGTYIYELFINLPTLIYDPWLDLTLDSLGVFRSLFLFFFFLTFLSVNVTVHILNIATRQELRGRQLGAQPMTRGQEPGRDLCRGRGWGRELLGWLRDRLSLREKAPKRPLALKGSGERQEESALDLGLCGPHCS